jgi:uncharacterized membrane protein
MRFERTIDIDAPAHQVWRLWTDVLDWPQWTASVTSVERLDSGPFGVGSKARVRQPRLPAAVWEVTECDPDASFVWVATAPGVRTTAVHRVTPKEDGYATAYLSVEPSGPLAGLVNLLYGGLTRRYLSMEAEGIKKAAESGG